MSKGQIIEGTSIAVDWWKPKIAPHIELYFLSHLYPDIKEGLTPTWNKPIYTSVITARLLILEKPFLSTLVKPLHFAEQHTLPLKSKKESVRVTLIDSKYCPGSAAFLLEGTFGKILYTGLFRFYPNIFSGIDICKIDILYFDNTYCSEHCQFPAQSDVTADILKFIKKHFGDRRIILACDSVGKEELLVKIYEETDCKIRVCSTQRMRFLEAADLSRIACIDDEKRIIQVDVSQVSKENIIKWSSEMPTEILLLSSRYVGSKTKPFKKHFNVSVIPFSSHSSFGELVEFVKLVQPLKLQPIILQPVKGMFDQSQGSLLSLTVLLEHVKKSLDIAEHEWTLNCLPSRLEDTQEIMNLLFVLSPIKDNSDLSEKEISVQTQDANSNDFNTQCSGRSLAKKRLWNAFDDNNEDLSQNKIIQPTFSKERFLRSQVTNSDTLNNNSSTKPVVKKRPCQTLDYQTYDFTEYPSQAKRIHPNSSKNVKNKRSLLSQSQGSQASSCTTVSSDDGETVTLSNSQSDWKYTQKSFPFGCIEKSTSKGRALIETSTTLCNSPTSVSLGNQSKSSQGIWETSDHEFSQPSQSNNQPQFISGSSVANSSLNCILTSNPSCQETSTQNGFPSDTEKVSDDVPKSYLHLMQKCQRKSSKTNNKCVAKNQQLQELLPVMNINLHYKSGANKKYRLQKNDL